MTIKKEGYKYGKKNEIDLDMGIYNTPFGTIYIGEAREAYHKRKAFFGEIRYLKDFGGESKEFYGNSPREVEEKIIEELATVIIKIQDKTNELEKFVSTARDAEINGLRKSSEDFRLQNGSKKYLPNPAPQLNLEENK